MPRPKINETESGAGIEWPIVWRASLAGFTGEILMDDSGDGSGDPRDADNLGHIVHWHKRYDIASDAERITGDFKSVRHIARYLGIVRRAVAIVPLGMLDHSGVSFYAGAGPARGDSAGWDSGQVGFIYATAERAAELCGTGPDGALYKPADYAGTPEQWLALQLRHEIAALDAYSQGWVYWYRVSSPSGDVLDACGGFLGVPGSGADSDGIEDLRNEVRALLRTYVAERAHALRQESRESARAMRAGIPTSGRCTL